MIRAALLILAGVALFGLVIVLLSAVAAALDRLRRRRGPRSVARVWLAVWVVLAAVQAATGHWLWFGACLVPAGIEVNNLRRGRQLRRAA